jgi:hypothetical protein
MMEDTTQHVGKSGARIFGSLYTQYIYDDGLSHYTYVSGDHEIDFQCEIFSNFMVDLYCRLWKFKFRLQGSK